MELKFKGRFNTPSIRIIDKDKTKFVSTFNLMLNKHLKTNGSRIRRLHEFTQQILGKSYYVIKLDILRGFWQLLLDERCRQFTVYTCGQTHWRYKVLPLGLLLSPKSFHGTLNSIIQELMTDENIIHFLHIDDLIVLSEDLELLYKVTLRIFNKFNKLNLQINIDKSLFFVK
jgi:hypothetical protein